MIVFRDDMYIVSYIEDHAHTRDLNEIFLVLGESMREVNGKTIKVDEKTYYVTLKGI